MRNLLESVNDLEFRTEPPVNILTFRLAGLFPQLIGALSNFLVGWIFHATSAYL